MFNIDKQSRVPIYEQVIQSIEKSILCGLLIAGDKIPSVRELSTTIGVNPNTLQKAYQDLESRHITNSVPGIGRFVSDDAYMLLKSGANEYIDTFTATLSTLKLLGFPKQELIDIINKIYEEDSSI